MSKHKGRKVKVAQSSPIPCNLMEYSPRNSPGQNTRVGSLSLLQGSSQPRDQTQVSRIAGRFFPAEPQGNPKNTGVGSLSLLQKIFLTQESTRGLLHCRWILYQLNYQGSMKEKLPSGQPPNWRTIILKKFSHCCEGSEPQLPSLGGLAQGLGIPRDSDFEGQHDLITGLPQDWDKQKLHSWRAQTKFCSYQDPGERSSDPTETEPGQPASVGGPFVEAWVGVFPGRTPWCKLS